MKIFITLEKTVCGKYFSYVFNGLIFWTSLALTHALQCVLTVKCIQEKISLKYEESVDTWFYMVMVRWTQMESYALYLQKHIYTNTTDPQIHSAKTWDF